MSLVRLLGRRLLAAVPILLLLSAFVFLLIELAPGDAATQLAGENATQAQIEAIRAELNLNDALPQRYASWVADAVRGDFGESIQGGTDVWSAIVDRLPVTLSIAGVSLIFAIVLGVTFGTLAALRTGRLEERVITGIAAVFVAVPPFVIALLLVMQLSVEMGVLPAIGFVPISEDPWEWFRHLILPCLALSAYLAAEVALQIRAGLLETLGRDFIMAARARGLSRTSVVFRHGARTAALPVVTIIGLRAGLLFGGTVIVESIFVMNGLGTLAITATRAQDVNMLLGILMVVATAVLIINALVDATYGLLNPKLRTEGGR